MSGNTKFSELTARANADPKRRARMDAMKRAALEAVRLADLRERRQLTQTQLATELGVSQSRISQMERGDEDLYLSTLASYISALGGQLELAATFPDGDKLTLFVTPESMAASTE
jgi:DNA-binding XRE family transcriptional regulator